MNLIQSFVYDLPEGKKNILRSLFTYYLNASFRVLRTYRVAKYFYLSKLPFSGIISSRLRVKLINKLNCDLHLKSSISNGIKLAHPLGIVVGAGVIIKKNVTIYQNVTLGSTGKKEMGYPIIGEGCIIYAGAIILGDVQIGENSVIGANCIINKDIPPNSIAYGNPLIIKRKDEEIFK
tara:strand:+ start:88158 stop:88691 length:534 start_codon:yes stop_codon:yes gene_type:complete